MWDPRDQTPESFLARAAGLDVPERPARRLVSAVVGRGVFDPFTWGRTFQVPRRLSDHVGPLPRVALDAHQVSPRDGFEKLRFRLGDGLAIETVLIPLEKPGAVSLCLSSQVGCAMGCVFCQTARMADRRNLQTWEIIDQFIQARDLARTQGRRVTGVVFMGMGEPFLNTDRVLAAAEILRCSFGGSINAKAITVSTVGVVPEIRRFTEGHHRFRLAISLGAATDAKRAELVPVAARWPVAEVMAAAREYAIARHDRVTLAYVSGPEPEPEQARALEAIDRQLRALSE